MIDLIVKLENNGIWKEGMIVDYIEKPVENYSENMEKGFLLLCVPDSWLYRVKEVTASIGDPEDDIFVHRVGYFDLDMLSHALGDDDILNKLHDKDLEIKKIKCSEYDLTIDMLKVY